jgi:hypothetical protein
MYVEISYEKDGSDSAGDDSCCVDDITFEFYGG